MQRIVLFCNILPGFYFCNTNLVWVKYLNVEISGNVNWRCWINTRYIKSSWLVEIFTFKFYKWGKIIFEDSLDISWNSSYLFSCVENMAVRICQSILKKLNKYSKELWPHCVFFEDLLIDTPSSSERDKSSDKMNCMFGQWCAALDPNLFSILIHKSQKKLKEYLLSITSPKKWWQSFHQYLERNDR